MKIIFLLSFITYLHITSTEAAKSFEHNDFSLYYPFFPFGKNFDYVLTDPPNYIFSEGDEDLGYFNHYLSKDLPIFHDLHVRDIFVSVFSTVCSLSFYFRKMKGSYGLSNPLK